MYQNYIFDLYGTLVDIRTNEQKPYLWEKMAEIYGFYGAMYERSELKNAFFTYAREFENEARKSDEFAEINIDILFRKLFTEKGVNVSQDVIKAVECFFRSLSTKFITLYDGVKDFLEELRARGKGVYLLSNAQSGFTRPELRFLGIEKYFDGILISSEEGVKKPSPRFFKRLTERFDLNISRSIMIGNDNSSDIVGANSLGMDSLYIHTEISPDCDNPDSTYSVMDGSFRKISELILG